MIDNMTIHHKAWQRKLSSLGLEMSLEEVKRDVHGVNMEILENLFGNRFTAAEKRQISWDKEKEYRDIYTDQIKLIEGLAAFIDQAVQLGIPMGIGTAAPKENMEFVLDRLNLRSKFSIFVNSDMVENGKPHPEVFEKVAKGLGISLEDCLIFEDSPTGAKTAQNGNCKAIILTTTHTAEEFNGITSIQAFMTDFTSCKIHKEEASEWYTITVKN